MGIVMLFWRFFAVVKLFQMILQFSNITILFDSIPDFGLSIFHQPSPLQFDLKQTIRLWDYLMPIPTIWYLISDSWQRS